MGMIADCAGGNTQTVTPSIHAQRLAQRIESEDIHHVE